MKIKWNHRIYLIILKEDRQREKKKKTKEEMGQIENKQQESRCKGLPGNSAGKESTCNAGDLDFYP